MRSLNGRNLGAYRLIEQVGIGGMAVIYKAYDPSLDRYVAVKLLPEYLGHDEEFSERFRNEARNVARLHHPNILPIYGYGEEDGLSYFVMALVEGGTLKELMGQPVEAKRAAAVIVQVANALDYAHQMGIVHRDVKPANVLMSRPDWPLLSDFGIARVLEQKAALTRSAFLGTPHYMAPEQARGEAITPRTDQYALGIVLYEMLTGTPPFQADTPQAVVYQHIYATLPLPHERNRNISDGMERVILKALAKDAVDRFPDMASFATAVQAAADGRELPLVVAPPTEGTPTPQEATRTEKSQGVPRPVAPPPRTEIPVQSTERIQLPPVPAVAPVTQTGKMQPAASQGRPWMRNPLVLAVLVAAIVVGAIVAFLATRGGSSSLAPPITLLKLSVSSGAPPPVTVYDSKNAIVADLTSAQVQAGSKLPAGKYVIQFGSGSGYNGRLPVTVGPGTNTVDLSKSMAFFHVTPASDVPLQGMEVDLGSGGYYFSLTSDVIGKTQALPPGSYQTTFNSGAGYLDPIRLTFSAGKTVEIKLADLYGRITVVPPAGASLTDFVINDAKSSAYYHSITAVQAMQGLYLRPGNYLIDLSSSNIYLDPVPVSVRAGAKQTVHLGSLFSELLVTPIPNTGMTSFDVQDTSGTKTIHSGVDIKSALLGVYLRPGSYLLVPSSTLYLAPIPITIPKHGRTALDLSKMYAGFTVIAAPGAPLTSFEVDDVTGKSLRSYSGTDTALLVYFPPGQYLINPSSANSAYLGTAPFTVKAGINQRLRLQSIYATLHVPATPSTQTLSYTWQDPVDSSSKRLDAQAQPQTVYARPGTYRVEVTNGNNTRLVTIHATAGKSLDLPK